MWGENENLHFEDLAGNEEANSNWRKVDDPGRHLMIGMMVTMVILVTVINRVMIIIKSS